MIDRLVRAACVVISVMTSACIPVPPPTIDAPLTGLRPTFLGESLPPIYVMPPAQQPTATVIVVHGLKGSAGVFAQPALRWASQGIETYAVTLVYPDINPAQLGLAIRQIAAHRPDIPLFIVGESLGASLTLATLARADAPKVDGVVLTGPAIWPDAVSAAIVCSGLRWLRWFAGSDAVFWAKVVTMMDEARDQAGAVHSRPILVLSGGRDEVVPRQGVDELVRRLGEGAQLKLYPEGGHTLFRNIGGDAVADQVAGWILEQARFKASAITVSSALPSAGDHASAK